MLNRGRFRFRVRFAAPISAFVPGHGNILTQENGSAILQETGSDILWE